MIMKKLLSALLCLCIITSVFGVAASEKSPVNIFNVTVETPQVGNKPDYNAYVPSTASTKVINVEWKGELDKNGCFQKRVSRKAYRLRDRGSKYDRDLCGPGRSGKSSFCQFFCNVRYGTRV